MLSDEEREQLDWLRELRVKADYHDDGVLKEEVEAVLRDTQALVERLLGEQIEW